MGVVYKAHDEQLEREVAIKVLPAASEADEDARKRFRKEALALARLNHPNIATIFEFTREQDRDILVTEYIPGSSLEERLLAGPLEPQELVSLGTQIAEGLAAAHEQGLVHRDIKPGNLRILPDGRLKILDFGLAQLAPRPSDLGMTATLTRTQQIAGTLPYMSPEQLRGAAADARTDIWAVGAVLHEMATSRRPFPDGSPPILIDAILNKAPDPASKTNRKISSDMDGIIRKALEKDPSRRYQSAIELRSDLQRLTAGLPVSARRKSRWGVQVSAAIVLLVLLLAGGLWLSRRTRFSPPAASRRAVAVLGFKNLTGNKEQAWLATALSEMLTTELTAGDKLRTVPGENVARARTDLQVPEAESLAPPTLSKLNRILGADLIVLGSYLDMDGQLRVDVRVQDASGGDTIAKFSQTGTEAQLFNLVRDVGQVLREKCGAGEVTQKQAVSVRASQPGNAEAAKLYAEGVEELRSYDAIQARDSLTQAVAKDPKFALGHEALATASSQLGYDDRARDEAKRAFELASALPRPEALLIEARYREASREWNKAVEIYRSLWTVFPDDPEYGLRLADAQVSAGQGQGALGTVERLRRFAAPIGDDPRIDLAEAAAARSLSDYRRDASAADAAIRKAQQRGSEGLRAEGLLQQCWALRNLGEPERAKAAGQQAGEILGKSGDLRGQARSLTCVADVLADQGQLAPAQQMHEQALDLARKIGAQKDISGALINVGNVLAYQQKFAESTRQYKLALALALSIGDKGDALLAQNNLGANLSSEGDFAGARKFFEDSVYTAQEVGDQAGIVDALLNRGSVSYLQGDLLHARQDLQRSIDLARGLQLKSRVALATSGLGDVQFAADDLNSAQSSYEQALQMRRELGEKGAAAASQVALALVALEKNQWEQAAALAREAAREFEKENDADQRTAAEDALVRALIAQRRFDDAANEIAVTEKLGARDVPTVTSFRITAATLLAETGKSGEAQRQLERIATEAAAKGLLGLAYRARLALGEAQLQGGTRATAESTLKALQKEAAPRGYALLARKALQISNSTQRRVAA